MRGVLCMIAVSLAGCGTLNQNQIGTTVISAVAQRITGGQTATQAAAPTVTRQELEAQGLETLQVTLESGNAIAIVVKVGENRGKLTWVTSEGIGITTENGMLIATRGLGQDLMAADTDEVYRALQNRRGMAVRVHDYLNNLNRIDRRSFQCEISPAGSAQIVIFGVQHATVKVDEVCTNPELEFTNSYWIDSSGTIWQSRQWISPDLGHLEIQRL